MHLHVRLADRWPTEVIPGVTAMSGCWSQTGMPIVQGDDVLTVLPGTMTEFELTRRLADTDAAVIMKVGRNLPKIRQALAATGLLDRAIYVERGTMANTQFGAAGRQGRRRGALLFHRAGSWLGRKAMSGAKSGHVAVIGLGPGNAAQVTPEASEAVAAAKWFYGYGPYVDRLELRPDQVKVASDNREEISRAQAALAKGGRRRAGRGRLGRRSRRLRHGGGGLRGDRGRPGRMARDRPDHRARRHRHAGGRGTHRRAARARFLRHLAVGQSEAVGTDRAAARRGGERRLRHRALQSDQQGAALAARQGLRASARKSCRRRRRSSSAAPPAGRTRRSR